MRKMKNSTNLPFFCFRFIDFNGKRCIIKLVCMRFKYQKPFLWMRSVSIHKKGFSYLNPYKETSEIKIWKVGLHERKNSCWHTEDKWISEPDGYADFNYLRYGCYSYDRIGMSGCF